MLHVRSEDNLPGLVRRENLMLTVDRRKPSVGVCGERDPRMHASCCMPPGHDTPHQPVAHESLATVGPLVVTNIEERWSEDV